MLSEKSVSCSPIRVASVILGLGLILATYGTDAAAGQGLAVAGLPAGDPRLGFGFGPDMLPGRDYVPGQLIVGLNGDHPEVAARDIAMLAQQFGGRVGGEIAGSALLLEFQDEQTALRAVGALLGLRAVTYVERNGRMGIPPMPTRPPFRSR